MSILLPVCFQITSVTFEVKTHNFLCACAEYSKDANSNFTGPAER